MGSSTVKLGATGLPRGTGRAEPGRQAVRVADLILVLILKPGEPGFIYHCQHGFMTPCWLVRSSLRPLAKGRAAPASSQTCRYQQYMDGEDGEDSEGFPS